MINFDNIISTQSPWRQSGKLEIPGFVERKIYPEIKNWVNRPEIITILGPRQVGKTTLLLKLVSDLLKSDTPKETIYYFNCDNLNVRRLLKNPTDLLMFLQPKKNQTLHLFFDEAQRLKDAGIFLKELKDAIGYKLKLYVSGSSSLSLRAKTKEYLTGRQVKFLLLPFSWAEFLAYKKIELNLKSFRSPVFRENSQSLLNNFLCHGGYPQIIKTENEKEKHLILENLVSDYLEKDISDFLDLDVSLFNKILNLISYQIGNIINVFELSRLSGGTAPTVNKYLKILAETYVAEKLPPFFGDKRKEFSHNPKIFFFDLGLRNNLIGNYTPLDSRGDNGALAENFVWSEFWKARLNKHLNFWATRGGGEVDFVLTQGQKTVPIEVKFQDMKSPEVSVSFVNFIKRYSPHRAAIITKNFLGERRIENTRIEYWPITLIHEFINKLLQQTPA